MDSPRYFEVSDFVQVSDLSVEAVFYALLECCPQNRNERKIAVDFVSGARTLQKCCERALGV